MCAETQNLEMALPSCQGTAFLSHPLCKSLTERGKRRKEVTDALKLQWGESESPGSSQRWSSASMCSRLPTSPGERPWKSCWQCRQLRSPAGMLCRDALARWGCLQHRGSPARAARERWCTAGPGGTSQTDSDITGNGKSPSYGSCLGCFVLAGTK